MPQSLDFPSMVLKRKALHSGQRSADCQKNESMLIVATSATTADVMPAGRSVVRRKLLSRFGAMVRRRKRLCVDSSSASSERKIMPAAVSRERAMRWRRARLGRDPNAERMRYR